MLAELEVALLELEQAPENSEVIDRVFRAMHTIKGAGAMFGFDDISAFTHDVETVFDKVRNGELSVTKELLDLTLRSRDHIALLLASADSGDELNADKARELTKALRDLVPGMNSPSGADKAKPDDTAGNNPATYRIRFRPAREIFLSGNNPASLLEELDEMGRAMFYPYMDDLPGLDQIDSAQCYLWWDVVLNAPVDEEAIREVFVFVEDECELSIKRIDTGDSLETEEEYKKLGEILVERGDISSDDLNAVLSERKYLGDILAEKGMVTKQKVESALSEQKIVRGMRQARTAERPKEAASSIRVAADKLDYLVDMVGELVIVQAQISQVVSERKDPVLTGLAEELERLSDELRDSTLGIRMLPIGTTFGKFRRLVRDLSAELGKEINLVTEGAETELDKTVIERLNDPLVHLLRNSIDHGVEPPDKRVAAGKSKAGTILLAAEHSGGEVLIRIKDDGAGVNADAVRKRALERGLITPDADLPDKEAYSLIFQPGFSTAAKVTNVSGRGVGMDVVKRAIDSLRGSIDVDSSLGVGTEITVKLPLTLAIIDGLQIRVGEEYYVIPLSLVEECVEHDLRTEDGTKGQRIIQLRGELVPFIRLREWFGIEGTPPQIEQIVVAGSPGGRVGIAVDNVIGEHQTVIKSLGRVYRDVQGISGATIKGDGTMALILDLPRLVQAAGAV